MRYGIKFMRRDFKNKLIVYAEQHRRFQLSISDRAIHLDHGQLNEIGG